MFSQGDFYVMFFLVDLSFNFKFFTLYFNLLDMESVIENNTLRMSNLDPLFINLPPFPNCPSIFSLGAV